MSAKKNTKPAKAPKAKAVKAPAAKKPAKAKGDAKRTSALDAAAKVLADSGEPMNTKQMIEAMAKKGLWTSPNGRTPWATLYSALLREINEKGADARFKKMERGKFAVKK
jgi:hypothetical protein